jgi:hypothetical protein
MPQDEDGTRIIQRYAREILPTVPETTAAEAN